MAIPAKPTVSNFPAAPVRGEARSTFATKANNLVDHYATFVSEMNDAVDWQDTVYTATETEATNAAASATAAATSASTATTEADRAQDVADGVEVTVNFQGDWSAATGSATKGQSYYHNGNYWRLRVDLADITTSEPSTANSDWAIAGSVSSALEFTKSMTANQILLASLNRNVSVPLVSVSKETGSLTNEINGNWAINNNASDYDADAGLYEQSGSIRVSMDVLGEAAYGENVKDFSGESTTPKTFSFNDDGTRAYLASSTSATVYQYDLDPSNPYVIGYASYNNDSYSASGQISSLNGMAFSSDGEKLYLADASDETIHQYSLSVAWDITSASYDSKSLDVSATVTSIFNLVIADNDDRLFVLDANDETVHEYSLSISKDISTGTSTGKSFDFSGQDTNTTGFVFKPDGTVILALGKANDNVYQYSLSSAWDLATASYDSVSFSVSAQDSDGRDITVDGTGSKIIITGEGSDSLYLSDLSTPWDLSTASFTDDRKLFDVSAQTGTNANDVIIGNSGATMWVLDVGSEVIYEYDLSTAYDVSSASYSGQSFNTTGQVTTSIGILSNADGTRLYVTDFTGATIYQYNCTAWDLSTSSYSGLSLDVSSEISSIGDACFNSDGSKLYVTDRSDNLVHQYSLSTNYQIDTASYDNKSLLASSEVSFGIAMSSDGKAFFASDSVNDTVRQFYLETADDISTGIFVGAFTTGFGEVTGLSVANSENSLYIINRTDDTVYQYDLPAAHKVLNTPYFGQYLTAVTNSDGQINTNYWTDINSASITDTRNGEQIYYSFSTDEKTTFQIVSPGSGARNIVRDNGGTWEYNSNATYGSETWTAASVNSLSGALSDALAQVGGFGDLADSSYEGAESVSTQDTSPRGVALKPDGTKMYVIGNTNDFIYQYTLSTPYDHTTSSYDSKSLDIGSQTVAPGDLFFKDDGTEVYVVDANEVFQYTLGTPWDISSGSFTYTLSVSAQSTDMAGIFIKPDGSKMWLGSAGGGSADMLYEYTLGTAWVLSSASYTTNTTLNNSTLVRGVWFSTDGLKLYTLDGDSGAEEIHYYSLGTAWTITSKSYETTFDISGTITGNASALWMTEDSGAAGRFYFIDQSGGQVEAYSLPLFRVNGMNGTQLAAAGDADFPALGTTLDLAITLRSDTLNTEPQTQGGTVNYDAQATYEVAIPGTDYEWNAPSDGEIEFKALLAGNYKVRVI